MRIILIDDVREAENHVFVCRTYASGIEALQQCHWHLLYLDHDLGEMKSGYDVLTWLESNKTHLPDNIILVTSNGSVREKMNMVIQRLFGIC